MPLVTVIIPTYNAEKFVERAYISLCQQTLQEIEIVFIDDRSEDNTRVVLERLKQRDNRIRITELEKNCGPARARNEGLRLAGAKWIAVLDADDSFAPTRLLDATSYGETSGADIVIDNICILDPASKNPIGTIVPIESTNSGEMSFESFLRGTQSDVAYDYGFFQPVIRTAWLRSAGLSYREDLRLGEDTMFMFDAFIAGAKIVLKREIGYFYNFGFSIAHQQHSSTSRTRSGFEALLQATNAFLQQNRRRLDPRSVRLIERRCKFIAEQIALDRLRGARAGRSVSALVKIVAQSPLRSIFGILYAKRLKYMRTKEAMRVKNSAPVVPAAFSRYP